MKQSQRDILEFERALLSLDRSSAKRIFTDGLASGSAIETLENLVVPVLEHIGEQWEHGEIALSQVYMSGRICEELVESVLHRFDTYDTNQPRIGIAVLEDFHILGKRIVSAAVRAAGFSIIDLGQGLSVDALVDKVVEENIDILMISVLMLNSALKIKDVKAKIRQVRPQVKIVVGGAPFRLDRELWSEVGADATGIDTGEAIEIIRRLTGHWIQREADV